MEAIAPSLALALERKREHYNALFVEVRQRAPELDGEDLLEQLRLRISPILAALPAASPEAEDRVLEVLYRSSLELLGRRLAGRSAPKQGVNAVWERLLPRVAGLVAVAPRRVVAALSNAAFHLDQLPAARAGEWLERMLAAAPLCANVETLLAAGQVAAWRAGLPHFRSGALALCRSLEAPLLQALLGWPMAAKDAMLGRLGAARFAHPRGDSRSLALSGKLGGFTGFGGPFATPPRLRALNGALFAHDQESVWEIHADGFGALLRRAPASAALEAALRSEPVAPPLPFEVRADGRIAWGQLSATFPVLAGSTVLAAQSELLALVLPRSHYIYLVSVNLGAAA